MDTKKTDACLVSIILPVYNGANYVKTAIKSILSQSYLNIELIVIDDCSTDNTLDIIFDFQTLDNRIKLIKNSENKKLPYCLNVGHKLAAGEFITWTSHDNILMPNFIQDKMERIKKFNCDFVYSDFEIINPDGKFVKKIITDAPEFLIFKNIVGASFLYKKEIFVKLNGYDENLFLIEDYDFWIRTSMNFKMMKHNEVTYKYRIHEVNLRSKILGNENERKQFNNALEQMIGKVANKLKWNKITLNFVLTIHKGEFVSVSEYLKNKNIIIGDIKKMKGIFMDENKIINFLRILMRLEYVQCKKNHTATNLIKVIFKDYKLLFNEGYSKKKTLTLILNSLSNW